MMCLAIIGVCLSVLGIIHLAIFTMNYLPEELQNKVVKFIGERFFTVTKSKKGELHLSGTFTVNLPFFTFDGKVDYKNHPQEETDK